MTLSNGLIQTVSRPSITHKFFSEVNLQIHKKFTTLIILKNHLTC